MRIALKSGLSIALTLAMLAGGQNTALAQTVSAMDTGTKLTVKLDVDGSAFAGPEKPPTVKDTLLSVCQARGYGEDCAKHLLGMVWKESRLDAGAIGDGGKARGWFQIHYKLHRISLACAEDLPCSANWTIDYLESNGYPKYVRYAIQCHNGCKLNNGYASSVLSLGERHWNDDVAGTPPIAQVAFAGR